MSSVMFAQEICDNGIDDDGDGLIDLNDDECTCTSTMPLADATGFVCRDNLVLSADDPNAISFQWYQDGVAILGETSSDILITENPTVEGNYQAMVILASGCYITEPYEVVVEAYEIHLGEETICPGDTIFFGTFSLTFSGFFQNNGFGVNGCDSITTLTVIVEEPEHEFVNGEICDGELYEFHDILTDVPGTYDVALPSANGCDSLVTLILTEGNLESKEIDASICAGEIYQEYGLNEEIEGIYESLIDNPLGCDTMITINLSVIEQPTLSLSDRICPGETYNQYGLDTNIPGVYDVILENLNGCDTLLSLEIIEELQPTLSINESICQGDTYGDYGIQATDSGSYVTTLTAADGCDTLLTIDLTVEEEPVAFLQEFICAGDTFIFQDIEESEAGTYTTTYDYGGICDSTVTIELIISEVIELDLVRTICEGEVFNQFGIIADSTGIYDNVINNIDGCDSIITLSLLVAGPTESFLTETLCADAIFELYDINTNTAGSYQTIIQNVNGCDSTINVELTVLPEAIEEVFYSICEGDQLQLDGVTYTDEDIYDVNYITENGCDSTLTINLTVDQLPTTFREVYLCEGQTYEYGPISETTEGVYEFIVENENECDSIITVQLFIIQPGEGVDLTYYHTVSYGNTIDISPEFMGPGVTEITWLTDEGEEIGEGPILEDFMTLTDLDIQLIGTDANGCPVEAVARIDVSLEVDIFVPNIFTPDGDGDNDRFQLYGGPTVSGIKELYVYDKWGNLMHSAKDVPATDEYIGWDGMFQGKNAIQGVYPYIATFEIVTGELKTIKGTVTVVY